MLSRGCAVNIPGWEFTSLQPWNLIPHVPHKICIHLWLQFDTFPYKSVQALFPNFQYSKSWIRHAARMDRHAHSHAILLSPKCRRYRQFHLMMNPASTHPVFATFNLMRYQGGRLRQRKERRDQDELYDFRGMKAWKSPPGIVYYTLCSYSGRGIWPPHHATLMIRGTWLRVFCVVQDRFSSAEPRIRNNENTADYGFNDEWQQRRKKGHTIFLAFGIALTTTFILFSFCCFATSRWGWTKIFFYFSKETYEESQAT